MNNLITIEEFLKERHVLIEEDYVMHSNISHGIYSHMSYDFYNQGTPIIYVIEETNHKLLLPPLLPCFIATIRDANSKGLFTYIFDLQQWVKDINTKLPALKLYNGEPYNVICRHYT